MRVVVFALIMAGNFSAGTAPSYADVAAQDNLTLHVRAPVWIRLVDRDGTVLDERIYERGDQIDTARGQIHSARIGNIRGVEFCFAEDCYVASSGALFGPVAVELTWTKLKADLIPSPRTSEQFNNDDGGPLYFDPDLGTSGSTLACGSEHRPSGVAIIR